MMINKRLIHTVPQTKKTIAMQVILQWISLVANIIVMAGISTLFVHALDRSLSLSLIQSWLFILIIAIFIRLLCSYLAVRCSYRSSKIVKTTYRDMILEKILKIGKSYTFYVNTSEIVQVAVEGIDQLETYFGQYLPQLFYALLAPLTLFLVIAPFSLSSAFILFICVPLIPITIILVQKWAKKLLSKYWGQYTALGDTFLENLQGLTTTKIYQSDAYKHQQMNEESEKFRKITMKVLTMQLNSITIMDIIAYGGAALGMIIAISGFKQGTLTLFSAIFILLLAADFFLPMRLLGSYFHIAMNGMAASDKMFHLLEGTLTLFSAIFILLLAADFFLPMRLLGSYFHIAMNGMAASDKMFHLLDIPIPSNTTNTKINSTNICLQDVSFGYDTKHHVLNHINLTIKPGNFIGIIGESGCGKSTLANLLVGKFNTYKGSITLGDINLHEMDPFLLNQTIAYIGNQSMIFKGTIRSLVGKFNTYKGSITLGDINLHEMDPFLLNQTIAYIGNQSMIFKGTIRSNLSMAKANATDQELWEVLEKVNLDDFIRNEHGLDLLVSEKGSNLSGGQRQRLALARALLANRKIYIFDEATSNIDSDSERDIMHVIEQLSKEKTVILISHRLANVQTTDTIYVMDHGEIIQQGSFHELSTNDGPFKTLWDMQSNIENFLGKETTS